MTSRRFVIWGSSGHAKVLASLIDQIGGHVVQLFDRDAAALSAVSNVQLSVGLQGFESWVARTTNLDSITGLVAIGGSRGRDRIEIQTLFEKKGLQLEPLIHPTAFVCPTAIIGKGSQILANAMIASEVTLGDSCIVNHGAQADHECRIGDGVHLAPGSILCGCVTINDGAMVGAGAVVLPRLVIGEDAIIGAGSVVTKNVGAGDVVAGNPARPIRK